MSISDEETRIEQQLFDVTEGKSEQPQAALALALLVILRYVRGISAWQQLEEKRRAGQR